MGKKISFNLGISHLGTYFKDFFGGGGRKEEGAGGKGLGWEGRRGR